MSHHDIAICSWVCPSTYLLVLSGAVPVPEMALLPPLDCICTRLTGVLLWVSVVFSWERDGVLLWVPAHV